MNKNKFWSFLLLLIGVSALWYTAVAGYKYFSYYQLDEETTPISMDWSVEEQNSSSYTLKASYKFKVAEAIYEGATEFLNDSYLNYEAARMGAAKVAVLPWKVSFDKDNPYHSTLQKDFPFKQCIYAIILWGIFIYFIFLKASIR